MNKVWRILEWIPKANEYKELETRRSFFGHYIPDAEPRPIPPDSWIHQSAIERMRVVTDYRPPNVPKRYRIIPMTDGPAG